MALTQVQNVLRLYLETCSQKKYEMQEEARAPSALTPVAPLDGHKDFQESNTSNNACSQCSLTNSLSMMTKNGLA